MTFTILLHENYEDTTSGWTIASRFGPIGQKGLTIRISGINSIF